MKLRSHGPFDAIVRAVVVMLALFCIAVAIAPASSFYGRFELPPMKTVGGGYFDAARFSQRNLLILASTRESVSQSKSWGDALTARYGSKLTTWDAEAGQDVLVVPVFDISAGIFSWMPRRVVALMVRRLGGGNNVLLDSSGMVRNYANPHSAKDAALILLGKDSTVEAIAVGDYSSANSTGLFAALDSALQKPAE